MYKRQHVLGEQIGVPVYSEPDSKDPVQIARNAIARAQQEGLDTVIDVYKRQDLRFPTWLFDFAPPPSNSSFLR